MYADEDGSGTFAPERGGAIFEHVFVNGDGRTAKPWTVAVSFTGQLVAIGAAVLAPLVMTDSLPRFELAWTRIFAPAAPPGPPPAGPARPRELVPTQLTPAGLFEPRNPPKLAALIIDPETLPEPTGTGAGPGVPGGTGVPGAMNPIIGWLARAYRPPELPPAVTDRKPGVTEQPERFVAGGLVRPPAPLHNPQPVYPRLAVQARISGMVRLEAIIAVDGSVKNLRLVSGHPVLAPAAIAAVRQWRYTPTLLNGNPVEVIMRIDVHFNLRQ